MIPDADIDPGSPLSSDLLKKLRDEWRVALCSPPSYTSLALRKMIYQIASRSYSFTQSGASAPDVIVTLGGTNELVLASMSGYVGYSDSGTKTAICEYGMRASSTVLRLSRVYAPWTNGSGVFSGAMSTAEWLDIAVNDTWNTILVYTYAGHTATWSIKAKRTGSKVGVSAKCVLVGLTASNVIAIQAEIYNPVNLSADA